jgi:hypothetical protein
METQISPVENETVNSIKLENHEIFAEYDSQGNVKIKVFSKGEIIDSITIKNSIIYKKRARLRL